MRVVIFTVLAIYSSIILSTPDEPDLHSFRHLVKRPVWPLTCQCSRDHGYPNYDTCRSAIAQLPTWTSWAPIPDANAACMLNLDFQENTRRVFRFPSVQLPVRRSFGACTVLVSGLHSLEVFEAETLGIAEADNENWWSIIQTAYQVNQACGLVRGGTGGYQLAGANRRIQVSLYAFNSRADDAVTHWMGEDLMSENPQPDGFSGASEDLRLVPSVPVTQDGQSQKLDGPSRATFEQAVYCILGLGKCKEGTTCEQFTLEVADILVGVVLNGGVGICGKA